MKLTVPDTPRKNNHKKQRNHETEEASSNRREHATRVNRMLWWQFRTGPDTKAYPPAAKVPINISTSIQSRATDLAFEAGDQIGLFVVNHQADGSAATLQTTGNYIDNTKFTYDGTWKAATPTYWKDNSTPADFYIYYPYTSSISNIEAMPWTVNTDQKVQPRTTRLANF